MKFNEKMSKQIQTRFSSVDNKLELIQDESIRSPFRFPGSKFQAIKFVKPIWESVEHDEFREPLVGGGAIFFFKPKVNLN